VRLVWRLWNKDMRTKRTIRAAFIAAVPAAALVLAPSALFAQDPPTRTGASAMVLTPLLEEFSASPNQPGARLQHPRPLYYQLYPTDPPHPDEPGEHARPDALRLADALLSAQADPALRGSPFPMTETQTTLMGDESGTRLTLSVFNTAMPDTAMLAFGADYAETAGALIGARNDRPHSVGLHYESEFRTRGDGLHFGFAPRAGLSVGDHGSTAQAGAMVRFGRFIGDDFGESRPAWWFFAGADQQALMVNPLSGFKLSNTLAFSSYATVGDAQAGVAMNLRGANLSLAYIRRETSYSIPTQSWDRDEGFAAFSLTLRR